MYLYITLQAFLISLRCRTKSESTVSNQSGQFQALLGFSGHLGRNCALQVWDNGYWAPGRLGKRFSGRVSAQLQSQRNPFGLWQRSIIFVCTYAVASSIKGSWIDVEEKEINKICLRQSRFGLNLDLRSLWKQSLFNVLTYLNFLETLFSLSNLILAMQHKTIRK